MKYLNGEYYVEVRDHRCKIHTNERIILRKRNPPTSLRTQYQVQNETQIWTNQKVIKNDNDQLVVKNYPKNKNEPPIFQKQLPNCPSCIRNQWLAFDKVYYCHNCKYIINKQVHQIDKEVLRQNRDFPTRLNYANKKIRKNWMNMVNTTYKSTEDLIDRVQQIKGTTKIKFYKSLSIYYDNMNIRFDEDHFAKNAQGIDKIYHEVFLLMKVFQTKPHVENMNIKYYDL